MLLLAANGTGLIEGAFVNNLTVAIILSMLVTPFGIAMGPHLAAGLGRVGPLTRALAVPTSEEVKGDAPLSNHVIIAGYGLTGRSVAQALSRNGTPYIIADLNTENVREATALGLPAVFGDVTSVEVLQHLGVEKAKEIIIAINDPDATARAARAARAASADVWITARTFYETDVGRLQAAGANRVIAAETAAANVITDYVLRTLEEGTERRSLHGAAAQPTADCPA